MKDMTFLPVNFMNDKQFNNSVIFSRELTENERWFQGAEDRLEHFFKHEYNTFTSGSPYQITENQTKFWKKVHGKTPRVHSGLPKLITHGMVKLVTSQGLDYSVSIEGQEESDELKERLELILDDNKFQHLFQQGAATESWAGYFFYKITADTELSEYPILELVSPKDGEAIIHRNRTKGYIFKSKFTPDSEYDKCLEIHAIYTFNDKGTVDLIHKAYEISQDGKETEVDIPADKKEEYEDMELGITFLPGALKNNTVYNSRFPYSNYGESDYSSIQALLHDVDDMYSQRELNVNNARAIKFIVEDLWPKDEDGNSTAFNEFQDEIEMLKTEMDMENFDINKFVSILQGDLKIDQYTPTIKELKIDICNGVGLDPETLGMVGYLAINSSAESKVQSQGTSLETRSQKLKLWREVLEDLFVKLLKYEDYMSGKQTQEYDVTVNFGDYLNPTMRDKVQTVTEALQGKVMDISTAVDELYGDTKEDDEKALIVRNIKIENFMPLVEENIVQPTEEVEE